MGYRNKEECQTAILDVDGARVIVRVLCDSDLTDGWKYEGDELFVQASFYNLHPRDQATRKAAESQMRDFVRQARQN